MKPLPSEDGELVQDCRHHSKRGAEATTLASSFLNCFCYFCFQSFVFSCPCLSYFHSFGLFRVRLIFTPRSRAPLTHSPILVLTPSPRPGQSENIVVFVVSRSCCQLTDRSPLGHQAPLTIRRIYPKANLLPKTTIKY